MSFTGTAFLASALLALARPPASPSLWALRMLLLALPVAMTAAAMAVLYPLRHRVGASAERLSVRTVAVASLLTFGLGLAVWLTQTQISFSLRSTRGLALLAIFTVGAIVFGVVGGVLLARTPTLQRLGPLRLGALSAFALLVIDYIVDHRANFAVYWPMRYTNIFVQAILTLAASTLARRTGWLRPRSAWVGLVALVAAMATMLAIRPERARRAYARVMQQGGAEARVLRRLRMLTDRDGDGFSPMFGGADCDDHDPDAYPLGPRDCAGLLRPPPPAPPPPAVAPVKRVLVITIDAWRCELGGEQLCPELERAAGDASYRGSQRVYMAQTRPSLSALFGGRYQPTAEEMDPQPSYLLAEARKHGFRSSAVVSYARFDTASLARSFDERDDSAMIDDIDDNITSGRVTARVRAWLTAHAADEGPRFFWTHYLDPHNAYVAVGEGEPVPLLQFNRREAYKAEVRRVDQHAAEVVAMARQNGFARDAAIVITGDHGESFGHGHLYHGTGSFDEELRVPLYVWLFDGDGKPRAVPLPPDPHARDLAALLAALVGAPPPPGQAAVSFTDPLMQPVKDEEYAVVDGGWKLVYHRNANYDELFHVAADPSETRNLVDQEPAQVARLRARLGEELARISWRPSW